MSASLRTSWDDHYMAPAFYGFVHWALGDDDMLAQFRAETGNQWEPARTGIDQMIDKATGADLQFMQQFADWCERVHFGTPADLENAEAE